MLRWMVLATNASAKNSISSIETIEDLIKEDDDVPSRMYRSGNFHTVTINTFQSILKEKFRFVTDASYDDVHSTAAIIFETMSQKHRLLFVTSVPSNITEGYSYNDAYRGEAGGILAGLTMIRSWEKYFGVKMSFTISCDNDRALAFTEDYWHTNTKTQHFDIAKTIIAIKTLLPRHCTLRKCRDTQERKMGIGIYRELKS